VLVVAAVDEEEECAQLPVAGNHRGTATTESFVPKRAEQAKIPAEVGVGLDDEAASSYMHASPHLLILS